MERSDAIKQMGFDLSVKDIILCGSIAGLLGW